MKKSPVNCPESPLTTVKSPIPASDRPSDLVISPNYSPSSEKAGVTIPIKTNLMYNNISGIEGKEEANEFSVKQKSTGKLRKNMDT